MKTLTLVLSFILATVSLPAFTDNGRLQATSLLGEKLYASSTVDPKTLSKLEDAKAVYEATPNDADAIIWYARRIAYTGDYKSAIEVFSQGIQKHPDDARMYRHRGHRYISLRDFDEAIADLLVAVDLIEGEKNAIEPDGAPNARNIPVSTKHGNIWYHLGLAYYLQHDFEKSLWAYKEARRAGELPDNVVSTSHWIYMILRRLGREDEAAQALDVVNADLDVIENFAYFKLCLLYKGLIDYSELKRQLSDSPQDAAMMYGLANWLFYNGEQDQALAMMMEYVDNSGAWPAFGFIAAEADLAKSRSLDSSLVE